MSMSEFNKDSQEAQERLSLREKVLPDDFSEEDRAFAQELEALFALDQEEIPPYFAQTLLEPEDARYHIVEPGFEQKISVRVFRRLMLPRRLFRSRRASLNAVVGILPVRRPLLTFVAACLLFMACTVAVTGTSFAAGLNLLLTGAHSGVLLVHNYPGGLAAPVHHSQKGTVPRDRMDLLEAQRQLHFPMYWPLAVPSGYTLEGIYLRQEKNQSWADGPVAELDFAYALPGVPPHGTGHIAICEFKPVGKIFQVVQLGAAHLIKIDASGHAQAIYIDGQWLFLNNASYDWVYSGRSELIYEHNGVIFWIVGDQRDGIDRNVLLKIASSLEILDINRVVHMEGRTDEVTFADSDSSWLFAGQVVYQDNSGGPSLKVIGSDG